MAESHAVRFPRTRRNIFFLGEQEGFEELKNLKMVKDSRGLWVYRAIGRSPMRMRREKMQNNLKELQYEKQDQTRG